MYCRFSFEVIKDVIEKYRYIEVIYRCGCYWHGNTEKIWTGLSASVFPISLSNQHSTQTNCFLSRLHRFLNAPCFFSAFTVGFCVFQSLRICSPVLFILLSQMNAHPLYRHSASSEASLSEWSTSCLVLNVTSVWGRAWLLFRVLLVQNEFN